MEFILFEKEKNREWLYITNTTVFVFCIFLFSPQSEQVNKGDILYDDDNNDVIT